MRLKNNALGKYLYVGVPATSLFILTESVTDPVNLTKFFLLGGVGTAVLFIALRNFRYMWKVHTYPLILSIAFVVFSIFASVTSELPLSQNLYGVYGRNTGLLTYFFLASILLGGLLVNSARDFDRIFFGLFFTGLINVLYCAWVIAFGDFLGWNNPYGNILGLFGNPNFIGAFLGIWISATTGFFLVKKMEIWKRGSLILLLLVACYEVYSSRAVQGVVVTSAGLATVFFFYIRSKNAKNTLLSVYTVTVLTFGIFALLGALQRGPLAEIVYKVSVSLRGVYWRAGIEMGLANPLTGVGMDGYGDWYRTLRSEYAATTLPGPTVVTNSAHNIPIDIFAYGGFPLALVYLVMIFLGVKSILSIMRRSRRFDPTFVALSVAWIGYQLQSLISINQIGLAVWGWLLTGVLIAYDLKQSIDEKDIESPAIQSSSKKLLNKNNSVFSNDLVAGIGFMIGLVVAAPPISADMAWTRANKSGSVQAVELALEESYLRPSNSQRLLNTIQVLENSKLPELALKYARLATEFNPRNFEAWFALYSVSASTEEDKARALSAMKTLDPFNAEIQSYK